MLSSAILGNFWCPVVTLVTFSSSLSNFERNPKKNTKNPKKNPKNFKKIQKSKNSKKFKKVQKSKNLEPEKIQNIQKNPIIHLKKDK